MQNAELTKEQLGEGGTLKFNEFQTWWATHADYHN